MLNDITIQVLFIAHIPSGDSDNLPSYGHLILNITKRYQGIIVGMLTGHTHKDQFQLVRNKKNIVLYLESVTTIIIIITIFLFISCDA